MKTTTIQVRASAKLKRDAQKVLEQIGLDLSSGINLFLTKVVLYQGVPFELRTADDLPLAEKKRLIRETEEAIKHGKRYATNEEMFRDILGEWPPTKG